MLARTLAVALAAGSALTVVSSACAELMSYEGFDGAPTGFTTPFPSANGGDRGTALPTSLSYGALVTNGGARQGGNHIGLAAQLDGSYDSGTVWLSWLFKSDRNAWNRLYVFTGENQYGSNEQYNLGYIGDGFAIRDTDNNPISKWAVSVDPATTYMLVAKFDFGTAALNDGSITLWINPEHASLGGAAPTVATPAQQRFVSGIAEATMQFNGIALMASDGGAITVHDEVRVGESWADVSPIPEPAALGALVASAALCLRRRKR